MPRSAAKYISCLSPFLQFSAAGSPFLRCSCVARHVACVASCHVQAARRRFVCVAASSSHLNQSYLHRLPLNLRDSGSFLCAVENGSGRAEGVSLSLVPQSCVDCGASRIGSRALAGNVECESLFLISRGTALPHSWCADSSASSAVQTPGGQAAVDGAKDCADSFMPPSVSSFACSQSSYGSKVSPYCFVACLL